MVQIFLSAASTVFLFLLASDILEQDGLAVGLALFYKLILDTSMWDGRILSDSLGMTLECMTLYFFYMALKNKKKKDYVLFVLFSILFVVTRTNAVSLLIVLFAVLFIKMDGRKKWITGVLAAAAVAAVMAGLLLAGKTAAHGMGERLDYYMSYYLQGKIVSGRPEYDYHVPSRHLDSPLFALDIVWMMLLKLKYYWSIYFRGYSAVHIAICITTILPAFIFTLYSVFYIIRDRQKHLYPYIAGIASYCFIQICTEVDFDMRYRAPIFLLCTICCAYGMKKARSGYGSGQHGKV